MTSAEEPAVLFEVKGRVGIATLNRPQRLNPVGSEIIEGLHDAVHQMNIHDDLKVLVVTAAGRGFCSGMDMTDMAKSSDDRPKHRLTWPRAHPEFYPASLFRNADFPVIGAINGVAAGAGVSLALASDIRIMSDQARLVPLFMKRGLMPDMGTSYLLTKMLGAQKTLELVLTAQSISAEHALQLGLVAKVVPHEKLMPSALELGNQIATGPPIAMAYAKRAIYKAEFGTLEADLDWGNLAQGKLLDTQDSKEGVKAFFEKREPDFKGR